MEKVADQLIGEDVLAGITLATRGVPRQYSDCRAKRPKAQTAERNRTTTSRPSDDLGEAFNSDRN
jgi:hypothetical protein